MLQIHSINPILLVPKKASVSRDYTPNNKILTPNIHNYTTISFRGNPSKHPEQITAYATESNFLGGIYKSGGLGDVAEALPESMALHGAEFGGKKIDVRTFLPYYSFDNNEGLLYVAKKGTADKLAKGEALTRKEDFFTVAQNYKLKEGESFALITEARDGNKVDKFFFMNDLNLAGDVERVSKDSLEMEKVPYRVFEVTTNGARQDKFYLIHTPEMASGKSAYGIYSKYKTELPQGTSAYGGKASSAYGGKAVAKEAKKTEFMFSGKEAGDMFFTEQIRAMQESLKKMDKAEFGNFNPQSWLLHDRFAYVALSDAAQKMGENDKYYEGIRYAELFHNPGRTYQGCFANPLDFFRVVATRTDVEALKANPNYEKVCQISEKIGKGTATKEECTQIYKFFKPYFEKFIDSEGVFNMTMIPVSMTKEYPQNSVPGNVSKFFGQETRNFATEDIAKGLTKVLQDIEPYTLDVVNGAKPANMATDKIGAFFGSGTLNEIFKDTKDNRVYTPFAANDSVDAIFKAKTTNKKNLINIIAEATENLETDKDAVAKVFFNETKMNGIRGTNKDLPLALGGLSKFQEGDILLESWGRPDPQKGLLTTLRSFRLYLTDETIPLETRKHTKLLLGAGGGNDAFRGEHPEWVGIKEEMEKIANLEIAGQKGIFKGNACYVNGLFPNRLANCADLGVFTSRWEPCGITPFESYATGTPVLSIKTGGAPDFVKPGKTGFLTEDPFMLSKSKLGLAEDVTDKALDKARVDYSAKQVAKQIKEYVKTIQDGTFEAKQKEYIANCLKEKVEWHNNSSYNGGRAALDLYLHDRCRTQDNNIPTEFRTNLRGNFNNDAFIKGNRVETSGEKIGSKFGEFLRTSKGKWSIGIASAVAICGLGYAAAKNHRNSNIKKAHANNHLSAVI